MAFDDGLHTFDDQVVSTGFIWNGPDQEDAPLLATPNNDNDQQWVWDDNDTTSGGVGPQSGAGGSPDGYAYTETSGASVALDVYTAERDASFDASANDITVSFKTNQRGDDNNATCVVETNENGAGWVERGATFGGASDPDKVASNGAQIWSQRTVDLTGLVSHATTRIRIKVTIGGTGTLWNNDFGIDEVQIVGADPGGGPATVDTSLTTALMGSTF